MGNGMQAIGAVESAVRSLCSRLDPPFCFSVSSVGKRRSRKIFGPGDKPISACLSGGFSVPTAPIQVARLEHEALRGQLIQVAAQGVVDEPGAPETERDPDLGVPLEAIDHIPGAHAVGGPDGPRGNRRVCAISCQLERPWLPTSTGRV